MKAFLIFASFLLIVSTVNATVHIVTCQNGSSHFIPDTVNAVVGDTIHWTWLAGVHITGPINASNIPNGAATWNAPIDAGNTDFEYVVTVAGSYHYVCHPSTPHGEDAYIEVTSPTGVLQYNSLSNLSIAYPNPSNGMFQFAVDGSQVTKNSNLEIYDLKGQIIYRSIITNTKTNIDLNNQENGIYFVKFYNGVAILSKKIVIL
ncbi:MAG: T9SS type A sorting domain-containing protein [Bacteroidetes bacterium]|nr:T9SS type A sorting domain-containing protein [Bacteroidota bacterium]